MCLVALKGQTYGGMFPKPYMHLTCVLYSIQAGLERYRLTLPSRLRGKIAFLAPLGDPLVPRLLVVGPYYLRPSVVD